MAALTSGARSCWVQWPQPGSMIGGRSLGTIADCFEMNGLWLIMHQDMRRAARIRAVSGVITEAFRRQRRILEQGAAAG